MKVKVMWMEYDGNDAPPSVLAELLRGFGTVQASATVSAPDVALPIPALEPPAPVAVPARRAVARKPAVRKPILQPKTETAAAEGSIPFTPGGTNEKVRNLLQKGPMSSGELIRVSRLTSPMVYTALSAMRKAGLVETREDPADAERKNYWVG